ncbi:MAG: rhodanese-like domain-containing protein [Candidatus Rokuibacteriota bacterium]
MATNVERIDVAAARQKVTAGQALLVCGYEDDAKCRKGRLEGSMPFARFEALVPSLPKSQEIIFYCA